MNDKQHWIDDETESMAKVPSSQAPNSSPDTPLDISSDASLDLSNERQKNADHECARKVGASLARLREEKNWVLDDISAHLKVSIAKLRALEAGDLDQLPDSAFAVGLLRSYAKVIGIDPTPFIEELHGVSTLFKTELSVPGMRVAPLPRNHELVIWRGRFKKSRVWIASIALALICAALYWGSASVRWSTSVQAPNLNLGVPPSPSVAEAKKEPALMAPPGAALPASALTSVAVSAPVAAPPSTGSLAGHQSSIHFKASQDNWVNVRQQDGKEIYSGVLRKDEERTVQGVPPFKLIVGNQAGLEVIELDGKRVDSSKYANPRQNNVVNFDLP